MSALLGCALSSVGAAVALASATAPVRAETKTSAVPTWQVPPGAPPAAEPIRPNIAGKIAAQSSFHTQTGTVVSPEPVATADFLVGGLGGDPGMRNLGLLHARRSEKRQLRVGPVSFDGAVTLGANAISQTLDGESGARHGRLGSGGPVSLSNVDEQFTGVYGTAALSVSALAGKPEVGRTIALHETAVFSFLSNRPDGDSFDQILVLAGDYRFTKLRAGLSVNHSQLSGLSRDVGADSERTLTTLALNSSYDFTDQTTLGVNATFPQRRFSDEISSHAATASGTVDYRYSAKSTLGVAATAGRVEVESQSDQHYQQVALRLGYHPTEKLGLNGSLGLEYRTADGFNVFTPVFEVSATWLATAKTSFIASATRSVFNSATVQNTNFTSSSFQLTMAHEVGPRSNASFAIGYENAGYNAIASGGENSRDDTLITGQLSFSRRMFERVTVTAGASAGRNWSNRSALQFFQGTIQTRYAF